MEGPVWRDLVLQLSEASVDIDWFYQPELCEEDADAVILEDAQRHPQGQDWAGGCCPLRKYVRASWKHAKDVPSRSIKHPSAG